MLQDIRHSLRLLARQRGFSAVAILILALGTGASAAVFSVMHAAVIEPLPYPHPEELVRIDLSRQGSGQATQTGLSPSLSDVRLWNASRLSVGLIAIERSVFPDRIFDAGMPERVKSMNVSDSYLPLYGVVPLAGRAFTAADMEPGAPPVLMLSHGFWKSRFGGDRAVIDRAVRFDGVPATIIGVLPPTFGRSIPVWRALQIPSESASRRGTGTSVVGRLRAGVTATAATDELFANLDRGSSQPMNGVRLRSMLNLTRRSFSTTVTVLVGAVGLVVLIACVNVAGLLLARGATRQVELAVRTSLGAGRARLIRQMVTESFMLSITGGLAGLLLASLTLDLIVANIPITLPGDAPASLSGFVLTATGVLVVVNALAFGLVPALRLSRVSTVAVMAAGRQVGGTLSRRGGQALIAVEVALAVVMVAGAGLMLRSFSRLMAVDLGFDPDRFLTMKAEPLDLNSAGVYYPALLERIRQIPEVEAVGAADYVPLGDGITMSAFHRPGRDHEMVSVQTTLPGFFEALGMPVRAGRTFLATDASNAESIVLSERAAQLFFPDGPAVGQQLIQLANPPRSAVVIGVVANVRHWGPAVSEPEPAVYKILATAGPDSRGRPLSIIVRPREGAGSMATRLREVAQAVGPPVIVDSVRWGGELLGERTKLSRSRLVLLTLLGTLGLLLALVGVFAMTSYAVSRRTREIGVRMALGAQSTQVVGIVMRDAIAPVVLGIAAGTAGAFFATTVIKTFLFETSPTDAPTLVAVAVLITLAGVVAAWLPARRAAKVDAIVALRTE